MPTRPRPLVAVRLIGPTAIVTAHAATIAAQLTAYYGRERVICRTSTRPAGYSGESGTYIAITPKEAPHGLKPGPDRSEVAFPG